MTVIRSPEIQRSPVAGLMSSISQNWKPLYMLYPREPYLAFKQRAFYLRYSTTLRL